MSYKRIRSLERGVAILQFINQMGAATAGEIAKDVGLPRPTVYRILDTLVESGLIYRSPSENKVYRLTEAVGQLSDNLGKTEPIMAAARRVLGDAPSSLPWPVFLATYSNEGMVIRETTRGSSVFWTEFGWVGAVAPLWDVAPGRAFVAFSSPELQAKLLADAPPGAAHDISMIHERGYAEERNSNGKLIAIAVPVGRGDSLVGGLAIAWDEGAEPEKNLVEQYLPLLNELRDQILEELQAESRPPS
jgi:IclR family mhp operon transcriptional activator